MLSRRDECAGKLDSSPRAKNCGQPTNGTELSWPPRTRLVTLHPQSAATWWLRAVKRIQKGGRLAAPSTTRSGAHHTHLRLWIFTHIGQDMAGLGCCKKATHKDSYVTVLLCSAGRARRTARGQVRAEFLSASHELARIINKYVVRFLMLALSLSHALLLEIRR